MLISTTKKPNPKRDSSKNPAYQLNTDAAVSIYAPSKNVHVFRNFEVALIFFKRNFHAIEGGIKKKNKNTNCPIFALPLSRKRARVLY